MVVLFLFGQKRTNITMTKEKKDKHYNDQREKGQTLQ
jgi:hypothetical protein